MIFSAVSNSAGLDKWLTSPVWISIVAEPLIPFTQSTASVSVPGVSAFGGFLNPIWLSLICMKLNAPASARASPISPDRGTPPETVQSTPAPAQTMHSKAPRRPKSCPMNRLSVA